MSRFRGREDSGSGFGFANFEGPARQLDGDVRTQPNTLVWDSEGKSRVQADIWGMTLGMSEVGGGRVWRMEPTALGAWGQGHEEKPTGPW